MGGGRTRPQIGRASRIKPRWLVTSEAIKISLPILSFGPTLFVVTLIPPTIAFVPHRFSRPSRGGRRTLPWPEIRSIVKSRTPYSVSEIKITPPSTSTPTVETTTAEWGIRKCRRIDETRPWPEIVVSRITWSSADIKIARRPAISEISWRRPWSLRGW